MEYKELPKFKLGSQISNEQLEFFDEYGFIHFVNVASDEECDSIIQAMSEMESQFLKEQREYVMGVPIKWGKDENDTPYINRFAYSSEYSEVIKNFVLDSRFEAVRTFIGENARLAEREKDGVVINNFINIQGSSYKKLGWHTDAPRDIFYNHRLPKPMLNVGLYLDDCPLEKGGVRILPGTHKQGLFQMLFKKFPMFCIHKADKRELPLVVKKGDLTIHDGRAWHRTEMATVYGKASQRRTMYMAYIDEPYQPRDEKSAIPFFKRFQKYTG